MPGSIPATSQLDWLISTTAIIVLSWSRATRDLLKSFGWGIGALHRFTQRRWCHLLAACPIASLGPGCEKAASWGNGTRAMPHRPSFSAPDDGFGGKLPIFPLGTLKLGDLRLRLGIPAAEVTDEVPVGRDIKNFRHPCGIKDGNLAEANPLRTR